MNQQYKLTPLGGLGETGSLNCMLYHDDEGAFLMDCGVSFVDDHFFPGVSLIVPDFSLLESYRDTLKGLVLTHGHEDHIGGVPYLLKEFDLPLYATPFTKGVLESKLAEFNLSPVIHEIQFDQSFEVGGFKLDPVYVNHSIKDVAAFLIEKNGLKTFHCTDLKIDHSATDNRSIDLARFKKIGDEGLDLLLLDSTNAVSQGWTRSESVVRAALIEEFTKVKGRIVACLFSSNSFRLQSLIECARVTGRKVALTGRSTKGYYTVAKDLEYLDTKGVDIYDVEDLNDFPDDQILVITAGSQAEARSVLSRMSRDMFRPFKIKRGDTIIMSSKMIPGNEGRVLEMMNNLALQGAEIITPTGNDIHASGHAKRDELREIIRITKPKHFLPIHGEYRHLQEHALLAEDEGLTSQQVTVALNGETLLLSKSGLEKIDYDEPKECFVSESPDHYIQWDAIKRRKKLAWNGLVSLGVLYHEKDGRVLRQLDLQTEGLFGGAKEARLQKELWDHLMGLIEENDEIPVERVQKFFKVEARHFCRQNYGIRPEVIVMVLNVPR